MWILYQLSHKGSPRILAWVTYPFSSGSSRPRNLTGVSYIAGRFFTNWVIREATDIQIKFLKHSSNCIISKSLISGKTCIAVCSSLCNWLHWRLLFTTSESMFVWFLYHHEWYPKNCDGFGDINKHVHMRPL